MKVLSIDPSLRNTAIVAGIIRDDWQYEPLTYHIISTEKSKDKKKKATDDFIDRCGFIYSESQALLAGTFLTESDEVLSDFMNPDVIFVESPSGSQSANAAKSYASSCFFISTLRPKAYTVTPHEVKVMSQGSKTATKHEMVEWVQKTYPNFNFPMHAEKFNMSKSEHIADAIAVAHVGIEKLKNNE